MFVMDCYGHKLSNGVLFAHHLILDVPGGSSHLGYRRRVPPGHNPHTRVNLWLLIQFLVSWWAPDWALCRLCYSQLFVYAPEGPR